MIVYNLNATLPSDIVIRSIRQVDGGHMPGLMRRAEPMSIRYIGLKIHSWQIWPYFFPYHLQWDKLNEAASILGE